MNYKQTLSNEIPAHFIGSSVPSGGLLPNGQLVPWVREIFSPASFLCPFRWNWLMWIGTVGNAVWLYIQVQTWWVPYLFGASERGEEVYHRVFAHSTKILPSFGNHLAPDAMQLTIQLFLIVIVASLIVGLIQIQRNKQPGQLT